MSDSLSVLVSFLKFTIQTFPEVGSTLYNAVKGWTQSTGHTDDEILHQVWPPKTGPQDVDKEVDDRLAGLNLPKASTPPKQRLSEYPQVVDEPTQEK